MVAGSGPPLFQAGVTACRDVIDHAPKVAKELRVAQKRRPSRQEASVGRQAGSLPRLDRCGGQAYGSGTGFCNVQLCTRERWPALRGR